MTLNELMSVTPAYSTVHVHDDKGKFAYKGHPHDFVHGYGLYARCADLKVEIAVPLSSYVLEVTVKEKQDD